MTQKYNLRPYSLNGTTKPRIEGVNISVHTGVIRLMVVTYFCIIQNGFRRNEN